MSAQEKHKTLPSRAQVRRRRRLIFGVWIGLTVVAAAYLAIAAPLITYFGERYAWAGAFVPPLMILLLGVGIGWFVLRVTRPGRDPERGDVRR